MIAAVFAALVHCGYQASISWRVSHWKKGGASDSGSSSCTFLRRSTVLHIPYFHQLTAALVERFAEIHKLNLGERPGETTVCAGPQQQRNDSLLVAHLVEREQEFALYPRGLHRVGRQNYQKPITASERAADRVVPLFGAGDVRGAIPIGDTVMLESARQTQHKIAVVCRVRKENFSPVRNSTDGHFMRLTRLAC